jgi:hypothetical protein
MGKGNRGRVECVETKEGIRSVFFLRRQNSQWENSLLVEGASVVHSLQFSKKKWIVGVCACVCAFAFFGTTIRNRFLPFNFAIVQIRTAGRYLLLLEYMTRTSKSSNHRLKLLIYRKAGLPYWRLVTCVWRKKSKFCPLLNM